MSVPQVDLTFYRGDNESQTFRFLKAGEPLDLTGAVVGASALAFGGTTPVSLTVTITTPTSGEVTIASPEEGMPVGNYKYDVEVTKDGSTRTWIKGTLTVEQDVTNAA